MKYNLSYIRRYKKNYIKKALYWLKKAETVVRNICKLAIIDG